MRDNRLRVGVDIDGVLANFVQAYREVCQDITLRELPTEASDWGMTNWNLSKEDHSLAWRTLSGVNNFHTTVLPYDETSVVGEICQKCRVFFITTRTATKGLPVEVQTALWLSLYVGVAFPTVLVVENKGEIANALGLDAMIDDKPENLASVGEHSKKTQLYLRDQPWNQDAEQKVKTSFSRVFSLDEFKRRLLGNTN
jgi:hypothetical protein